jgi:hypothetical protein
MMGGEAGSQEDMFAKLESMRAVITEVNTQFKDPVREFRPSTLPSMTDCLAGKDHLRLRLHLGVLVAV